MSRAPIVLLGYGNLSRGDDALGPALLERLAQSPSGHIPPAVYEPITDFQLQIEHVTDLAERELLLFIDASVSAPTPFGFSRLAPRRDHSYSSHSLSPATLLSVYAEVYKVTPPPAYLLTIPGRRFELGEPLSQEATTHLACAVDFVRGLLAQPNGEFWNAQAALMVRL